VSTTGDEPAPSVLEREVHRRRSGLLAELWGFLRHNRKWWVAPIILAMLAVSAFLVLGSGLAAPFIYTLF
jgi:hypothetical protein